MQQICDFKINVNFNDGIKINEISYKDFISNYQNLIKNVIAVEIISGSEIPDYAFASFENLTEVFIYSGIEKVGCGAFNTGGIIEKITIPNTINLNENVFECDESNFEFMNESYAFTYVKKIVTYNNEKCPMLEQNTNEFQLQ